MFCHQTQFTSTKTNLYTYLNKRLINYIKLVITVKRDCKIFNWIWDGHILQCNMNFECWTQSQNLKQKVHCEIWGSHASVAENSSTWGREAALLGEVRLGQWHFEGSFCLHLHSQTVQQERLFMDHLTLTVLHFIMPKTMHLLTKHYVPENYNLQRHYCVNLKTCIYFIHT